jgi:hypothetical protein
MRIVFVAVGWIAQRPVLLPLLSLRGQLHRCDAPTRDTLTLVTPHAAA